MTDIEYLQKFMMELCVIFELEFEGHNSNVLDKLINTFTTNNKIIYEEERKEKD